MNETELAEFHARTNEVLDMVDAYREALLRRGYSPTAAEQMTVDWHRTALAQSLHTTAKAAT